MSAKKTVSRNVAIALGTICIILIALIAYFTITGISAQNSYSNLQNQNKQLQTWLAGNETLLRLTESWLNGNITHYTSQITNQSSQTTNLQNQLRSSQEPMLGFTNLTVEDNRTNPQMPYLHIRGVVHNFGIEATDQLYENEYAPYWGFVRVRAYHNDGSVALETENDTIGHIDGQSSIDVDMSFHYNGTAITSWNIFVGVFTVI